MISETQILRIFFFLALTPLFAATFVHPWTWGTMDEPRLVAFARDFHQANHLTEKINILTDPDSDGRFRPLYNPYIRLRYVLSDSAYFQRIIQLALLLAICGLWFAIGQIMQEPPFVQFIGSILTIYFSPLSIAAINFPSIQEVPVLCLISLSIYLAIRTCEKETVGCLVGCLLTSTIALFMKETTIALLPPIMVALYQKPLSKLRRNALVFLIIIQFFIPFALLHYVRGGYSATYQLSLPILIENGGMALKNLAWSYKFAFLWTLAGLFLIGYQRDIKKFEVLCISGVLSYFAILLPWTKELTYYHGPLAPFMGFLTARLIWRFKCLFGESKYFSPMVYGTLVLCCISISRQAWRMTQFNRGLKEVEIYLMQHLQNERVYLNDIEGAFSIARSINLLSGMEYKPFTFSSPGTKIDPPAFIVNATKQERYQDTTIPINAQLCLKADKWEIYYVPLKLQKLSTH